MRNGATTWRDRDRARNVSESRISQASEADLGGPLPMSEFFAAFRFLSFYTARVKRRPSGAADLGLFNPKQRTSEDCRSTSEKCRYCCKSRKSDNPKNLAKVDLWTSLPLRRFSTSQRRSVIDFE